MIGWRSKKHKWGIKIIRRGLTNLRQMMSGKVLPLRRIRFKKETPYPLKSTEILSIPRRRAIERAERLVSGELVVDVIIKDAPAFSRDNFDWNIFFSNTATTFQLYLQSLNPVGDLVAAFNQTKKDKYFALAQWFVDSWVEFSSSPSSLYNEYIWDHHAAALRAENLLYYLIVGCERGILRDDDERTALKIIELHGDFLSNSKNYLDDHNHGVYQDRALLYLATTLNRSDWTSIALERLDKQWDFLFTDEMVCVENSFTYQRVNCELFLEIARFQQNQGNDWGIALIENLKHAQDFMGHGLLPNATCAPFGDTFVSDYSDFPFISGESVFAYASRKGRIGKKPIIRSKVYPKSGYYFGREYWGDECATWTMFRSGYSSITHKQADDNSFMLYGKGYDIFVDSGLYTYMFRDPIRIYTRSANAHNTVIIDETSFPFQRIDCTSLTGIIHHDVGLDRGYDYVAGFNALYLGVFHVRHFIFLEDALFILDEIESSQEHCYSQLFHCGKEITLERVDSAGLSGKIGNTDSRVELKQIGDMNLTVSVINGSQQDAKYGFWSDTFNEYSFIDTVKFDLIGTNVQFATLVCFSDSTIKIDFCKKNRVLTFTKNEKLSSIELYKVNRYEVVPEQAFTMTEYEVEQDGGKFTFTNNAIYEKPVQYAWYVIAKSTKKPVKTQMYTDSQIFFQDFSLLGPDEYAIRAFVMEKGSKIKVSQIIGHIDNCNEEYSFRRELEIDAEWLKCKISIKR